jgi:SSS family solute:Na+ symporter
MHIIDWVLMLLPMLLVICVGVYTRRFVHGVADFMAGGRNAGRYLLCTARAEMTAGAALFVAQLEKFSKAGYSIGWWDQISVPVLLIVAISGFVIYRYRETRAMTLAQFFEMRYSHNFRLFSGCLGFFAGMMNFGVIPVVGARFFVYFLQLPAHVSLFFLYVPTWLVLMACFLTISTLLSATGGQVTILAVDCIQGMISQLFYVIIAVALVLTFFTWTRMTHVMLAQPKGQSFVNPFDSFGITDFNLWAVLMGTATWVYGTMAWQNQHAFNSSAATPHDSRMGGILGRWRGFAGSAMASILAVCILIFLRHPDFAAGASQTRDIVAQIPDHFTAKQMSWPIALTQFLPLGIKGMFCSVILMGLISGDGMALHSWGSILIQDVIVPLRKRPLSTRHHMMLLRMSIVGVAVWALIFGAIFPQTEYLFMYWAVTQAIFVSGAGIAIIGGLYWSRGTTAGAWAGMFTGSVLSVGGILTRALYPAFPLNGLQISFFGALIAVAVYMLVSVLTCRKPHDMDRLLHRGIYAIETDQSEVSERPSKRVSWLNKIVGIDSDFSRSDRWITIGIAGWSMFWFAAFAVGSAWYLCRPWSDLTWAKYWCVTCIWLPLVIGVVTTIWFTIACTLDLRLFFFRLKTEKIDQTDDGSVPENHSEEPILSVEPSESLEPAEQKP